MMSAGRSGRLVGAALFLQLVGLSLPFILTFAATSATPLEDVAGTTFQIRTAIFLFLANAVLTLWISTWMFPQVRGYSIRMSVGFVSVAAIWVVMQSVDNAFILSVMSLSQRYTEASGTSAETYGLLAALMRSTRRWIHFTELLVIDAWFVLFYAILYRIRLVPRPLAGFGLLAVLLHTVGIPLPMFAGYSPFMPIGFALLVSHLAIGGWLVVKGFESRSAEPALAPAVG